MNPIFKYLIRALLSAGLCLLLCTNWGCAKYDPGCELVVMPRRKAFASSPPDGKAYQVRIYVFYIGRGTKPAQFTEAENWRPLSYADAEAGIITNRYTGEVRSTEFFREQAEDSYIYLPLTSSPVVLVAVNEYDKYYAWRAFKYESPMPRIVISVMFDLKKSTAENPYFKDSSNGWIVTAEQFETGQ